IELQNLAGMQTGFGKARSTSVRGVYKVAVRVRCEKVGRAALVYARDMVMAAINDDSFDVNSAISELKSLLESGSLGPSTACIVDAAAERKIPSLRLNDGNLVQLGYGARQRRIWTAETDKTSAIGESISSDKDLTKSLLQSCGVPVPEGRIVSSAEDAWEAAEDIGLPVVVKPSDGNHGRGVSTDLKTREEVDAAYALADEEGSDVIVERFIPGNEHRILVVGGKVVAAARGKTASVIGDGKSTIEQLIDLQINTDPRRGTTEEFPLNLVLLDEDPAVRLELTRQGFARDSVPPQGKEVLIQRNGNVAFDVTDQVHPDVAAAVALAARIVGLDIAGVDVVAEDISRPLEEQGGAIVEVNAGPGLLMHLKPADSAPQPVGRAIVDHLFKEDDNGRIPIVGVTGSIGTTLTAKLIARLLEMNGSRVGLACGEGFYLNRRPVEKADCANWRAARRVLMNPSVTAAVLENGARNILREGLAYDRCDVGVVTRLDASRIVPDFYIHDTEQLANVVRTQVDVVLDSGSAVLNANDEQVAELASLCDGDVIYFSATEDNARLREHREAGKRCVVLRRGEILLWQGGSETLLVRADALQYLGAQRDTAIESVLAAIGAAWAMGVEPNILAAGISTYGNESERISEKDSESVWYKRMLNAVAGWWLAPAAIQKALRHGSSDRDLLAVHKE
ncbi:MAG: cphA, partial [Paucimonas sp.]|nr:cphA [Paucimonas sp.]